MMDTRLFWFLVGCAIGIVIGYLVRSLREIKETARHVEKILTDKPPKDSGLTRIPILLDTVLLIVVIMTAYASFVSQRASHRVEKQQKTQDVATQCNKLFLTTTLAALNERTTYTQQGTDANVSLQRSFNNIVILSLKEPPVSEKVARQAVLDYAGALSHFLSISDKTKAKVQQNPFPTPEDLETCLKSK